MPVPVAPSSPRLAYDIDGSYVFMSRTVGGVLGVPNDIAPAAVAALNSDRGRGLAIDTSYWDFPSDYAELTYTNKNWVGVLFPTPVRLTEMFLHAASRWASGGIPATISIVQFDIEVQASKNTTNGLDGTWETSFIRDTETLGLDMSGNEMPPLDPAGASFGASGLNSYSPAMEFYQPQEQVTSGRGWFPLYGNAFKNVRGIRLLVPHRPVGALQYFSYGIFNLHLYGVREDSSTEHRIEFIGDRLDFGDIGYDSTDVRTIRLKNMSSVRDADDVVLSVESSTPVESPNPTPSIQLSLDGTTWTTSLTFDIPANTETPDILVRLDPVDGLRGFRHARLKTFAGTWSS